MNEQLKIKIFEQLNINVDPNFQNEWNEYNETVMKIVEELIKISKRSSCFTAYDFVDGLECDVITVLDIMDSDAIGCDFNGIFTSCEKCLLVKGSDDCECFEKIPCVQRIYMGDETK